MIGHVHAIARNTFRETVRDRIFYLVGFFGLAMVGSSAVLSPLTIGAQGKIVTDVGLAAMTLFGLAVVILVGSNMVRKELEKRTATTILTKPVTRHEYLFGKFCGLSATVFCMMVLMAALFIAVMMFTPAQPHPRMLAAIYLAFLELTVINAAVVFFSTFVSPALSAMFTLGLFVIGHLSDSILRFGTMFGSEAQALAAKIVCRVLPNLELFNVRGPVVHGVDVPLQHLAIATVYGLGYAALLVVLGGAIFARRELK